MKKSLFALAATTAIAGAAQAQSSVTVYGLLDAGYVGGNSKTVTAAGATTKQTVSAFGQNQENTSRLGFKGTEDLGGGSSAFFTVEMGLTPQNPNLSGASTGWDKLQNNQNGGGSALDNRQAFLGLKKNGIGQFAFGRQYTPIFNQGAATDPSQYANVAGNVIYLSPGITADANSGQAAGYGFTNRASNALTFKTDNFAGFSASGMYALNNSNSTVTTAAGTTAGGNANWNGWGLAADFTWKKLYATAAYQSFKTAYTNIQQQAAAETNLNGAGVTSGQVVPAAASLFAAQQTADKQTYAAVTYDFGILKAYAQWIGRKIQNDYTVTAGAAGQQLNRTAQQIGVRSYITPTIEAWASVGTGKVKGPIAANVEPSSVNIFGYQLGSNYYLSKRTNLYAIYGQSQSTSSASSTAGSGASVNQYTVGLRHTF
ncbi:porin [Polynucleobacter sp. AP-Kolm-20A-A1]|uniref:porin n=1 Tax=Polynucleobacter sp. AP-Kolm-20A-A1 TaxID=2081041 RepID=UPI001BFD113E|nr:porin [Polynucleobacter sp. AP-Kolm-20A-A1]QWE20735.1 porin [Polynucleobacter sp. AP-Kolm-20A-A1]